MYLAYNTMTLSIILLKTTRCLQLKLHKTNPTIIADPNNAIKESVGPITKFRQTIYSKKLKSKKAKSEYAISPLFYTCAYYILRILFAIFFRFSNEQKFNWRKLEGPSIVIAPHSSLLDPLFVMLALGRQQRLHFVAGSFLQEGKGIIPWITAKMKTINITQFNSDFVAVKQILTLLHNNESIAIFPEGERTPDGRHELFSDAFIKLIQRSKANIIFCNIDGAFLSWPRWSGYKGLRFGKITTSSELIYTANETSNLELETIREKMAKLLEVNDYHNQLQRIQTGKKGYNYFHYNLARGLDNLLYSCPSCQEYLAINQEGPATLACAFCNFKVTLAANGLFKETINFPAIGKMKIGVSANPIVWHLWQIRHTTVRYLKELAPDYIFPCSGEAIIEKFNNQHASGTVVFSKVPSYFVLDWATENPRFTFAFHGEEKNNLPDIDVFKQELSEPNARSIFANSDHAAIDLNYLIQLAPQHFVYEDIKSYIQFWHHDYRITYYPTDVKMAYVIRDLIEGLGQAELDPRLARCHADDARDLINDYKIKQQQRSQK